MTWPAPKSRPSPSSDSPQKRPWFRTRGVALPTTHMFCIWALAIAGAPVVQSNVNAPRSSRSAGRSGSRCAKRQTHHTRTFIDATGVASCSPHAIKRLLNARRNRSRRKDDVECRAHRRACAASATRSLCMVSARRKVFRSIEFSYTAVLFHSRIIERSDTFF